MDQEPRERLFAVEYDYREGSTVLFSQSGLKFRDSEPALRRRFAAILKYVSFKDLLGEAVFWFLLPSTAAIWSFPFLLRIGIGQALIIGCLLIVCCQFLMMATYVKALNYLVFALSSRVMQFVAYAFMTYRSYVFGQTNESIALIGWFVFVTLGISELLLVPLIPVIAALFPLSPSDQALKNVGQHYAREFGVTLA